MRTSDPQGPFTNSSLVTLKDEVWLAKQRIAGKVAAGALSLLEREVKNGTTKNLLELDKLAETYIRDNNCSPTFLNYHGFPNSVCISIGKQLVHGIPTDKRLESGDVVSFDLGATYYGNDGQGAIGDTALTVIYGEPKSERHIQLVKATEEALTKGIQAIVVGKRLGCIGQAIYQYARSKGYGVVDKYGGHGLSWNKPHDAPFVSNKSIENEGIRLTSGMTLAIEPMLTVGSTKTWTDADGWTVWCDAEISSHQEHSIFVHKDHVEVITWRENETHIKSNRIYFNENTT